MPTSSRFLGVTLAILMIAFPAGAADPPSEAALTQGRERFQRGVELFRDGDHRAALIEFNRANDIAPSYKIQFNIGQACLELQDYACALRAYGKYLEDGGKGVPKDRRQLVEREIARTKKLVGTLRIVSNRDGADVTIDDVSSGRTPLAAPILISAGRHKITLTFTPLTPATRVVDVAGGDELQITIDLADPAPPPVISEVPQRESPSPQARREESPSPSRAAPPSRTSFWIGVVTTTAFALGTGVTGALALSAKSDLDDAAGRLGTPPVEVDQARTKLRTFATVTDMLLGTTALAAGITVVLYFTSRPTSKSTGYDTHPPRFTSSGALLF